MSDAALVAPVPVHAPALSTALVELRRYTLHPGQRDVLIDLFDREFVETQEAKGMAVIGQFRDLDRPDAFVWMRGFPDMAARLRSLTAFYDGPVWRAHRDAANPTMIAWDDVLLLEPAAAETALALPSRATASHARLVVATVEYPHPGTLDAFARFFQTLVRPAVTAAGATVIATYVTSTHKNDFRLPVREGETAFVWLATFADAAAYDAARARLAASDEWRARIAPALEAQRAKPGETLRLAPTSRSRLR